MSTFRKLRRIRIQTAKLTSSRCDCPPSLNTFVGAVSDTVARGAAFPTGWFPSAVTYSILHRCANDDAQETRWPISSHASRLASSLSRTSKADQAVVLDVPQSARIGRRSRHSYRVKPDARKGIETILTSSIFQALADFLRGQTNFCHFFDGARLKHQKAPLVVFIEQYLPSLADDFTMVRGSGVKGGGIPKVHGW